MTYTLEFTIAETPKSPNTMLGAHWTTRKKHADRWRRLVWAKCWHLRPPEPLTKAKLTLTRYSIQKMDHDNALSSFKAVTDALVHWGIIKDDSPSVIVEPPVVLQEKAVKRQRSIRVKVEGL